MVGSKRTGQNIWLRDNPQSYTPDVGAIENEWQRVPQKNSFEKFTAKSKGAVARIPGE